MELLGFSPQNFYFHHTFVHFVGEVKHTVFHKGVGRAGNAGVLCTLTGVQTGTVLLLPLEMGIFFFPLSIQKFTQNACVPCR